LRPETVTLCVLALVPLRAWPPLRAQESLRPQFNIPVREFKLKNGLRVILSPDPSAPTYAVCVAYNVGSRDERPGETGSAHLLEHLMFRGSANVGEGEHSFLVLSNGGVADATTNTDRTNYCNALPANQLELGLFLEADRMRGVAFEAGRFEAERRVVLEERKKRIDNQAYGSTGEALSQAAFHSFAYRHPMVGYVDDLKAASLERVRQFHRRYYLPNNAVLAVVGDFRPKQAAALVRKHFEGVPAGPAPPAADLALLQRDPERRKILYDQLAKAARIDIAYSAPAGNTPDWYSLAVAGDVIADSRSSKLYQTLVRDSGLATSVSWNIQQRRAAALGTFVVVSRNESDLAKAEAMLYREIERFKEEPVEQWQIEKVRRNFVRSTAERFERSYYRAVVLSEFALYYDDPGLINTFALRLCRVSKIDIQRAARAYWTEATRTVVVTLPSSVRQPGGKSR